MDRLRQALELLGRAAGEQRQAPEERRRDGDILGRLRRPSISLGRTDRPCMPAPPFRLVILMLIVSAYLSWRSVAEGEIPIAPRRVVSQQTAAGTGPHSAAGSG